jgi:hypothetical protein
MGLLDRVLSHFRPPTLEGPWPESRVFFLALVPEFNRIIERVRPAVDRVFREWLDRPLNGDLWQDVKLAGFGVEDPRGTPPQWDVAFEATGAKWLGITVPIVGDQVQEAVVDTRGSCRSPPNSLTQPTNAGVAADQHFVRPTARRHRHGRGGPREVRSCHHRLL